MAVQTTTVKTVGRLIFELERGEEQTARSIDIPFPRVDVQGLQTIIDQINSRFTSATEAMNVFVQPSSWRDEQAEEDQWRTVNVRYEIIETATTPITPTE